MSRISIPRSNRSRTEVSRGHVAKNKVVVQEKKVCRKTRIKEPQSSTISPRTHTVLQRRTTAKKIIRLGASIPGKPWNTPPRLTSWHRKRTGNQKAQLAKRNEACGRRSRLRVCK